jgi:hypothetical protein
VFSQEVWFSMLRTSGRQLLVPTADSSLVDWWLWSRKRITKEERKDFDSFVQLIAWSL